MRENRSINLRIKTKLICLLKFRILLSTSSSIAWRWSRRPGCAAPAATQREAANDNKIGDNQCLAVGKHYHFGYTVGISAWNVRWIWGSNQTRHNHDIHVFRSIRYVQRVELPIANEEHLQSWPLYKQNVSICRWIFTHRAIACDLFSTATNGIPNGSVNRLRFTILGDIDIVRIHCVGGEKVVRTHNGATHAQIQKWYGMSRAFLRISFFPACCEASP